MNATLATRQTHVAVECRMSVAQAEAIEKNLAMFAGMVRKGVAPPRGGDAESLLAGLEILRECLALRMQPFDR